MSKNAIFYFTGTGNSLKVARDIANEIGDCDIFLMPKYKEKKLLAEYERVGFVFPVYGGEPPSCVKKFIEESDFSLAKNSYFFAVATYGGVQVNSYYVVSELLKKQGVTLNAGFGVKMPGNYIVAYNLAKNSDEICKNSQQDINMICEKIKQKETTSLPKHSNKVFNILNRYFTTKYPQKDKNYNISESCIGCSICSKVCPVENIKMLDNKPTFKHHCEQCMACINACPKQAINYKKKTQNRRRYINPEITIKDLYALSTDK